MLSTMQLGFVFNIQKYSLHDGPGIRTTVFLKGCPLRCWWCHNPEGMSPDPEVLVAEGRCTMCGQCREVCPQGERGLLAAMLLPKRHRPPAFAAGRASRPAPPRPGSFSDGG